MEAVLESSFVEVGGEGGRERERKREKLPESCITVDGEQGECSLDEISSGWSPVVALVRLHVVSECR